MAAKPDARRICMDQCRAGCCRGPSYLPLAPHEIAPFRAHARSLNVQAHIDPRGRVPFLEHDGERCPMLDAETHACRIYAHRPSRCRAFPEAPRPGCRLSQALTSCSMSKGCDSSSP